MMHRFSMNRSGESFPNSANAGKDGLYNSRGSREDTSAYRAEICCIEEPGQSTAAWQDGLLPVDDQRMAAFIETSERYRPRLLSAARRIAPTAEDAEDMVQDALMKAYRKLSQFRNESRMETWLYTITRNSAREYLRRQKGRNDVSLDQPWNEEEVRPALSVPDPGMSPEEHCLNREMKTILLRGLERLGPKCKQAILLCIIEDLPQRIAAKHLKVRPATVKARIFHGKQTLKRSIRMTLRERAN